MIRKNFFIFLLIILITINGCWDRRELETLGLIQVLGIDLGPEKKGVTITVIIAIPSKIAGGGPGSGGGGGGDESGVFVSSMDAPSIYEGINLLNTTINRELTLLQNSVIIFGEDLAKGGVQKWIDNLARFREMRRTNLIFVCQGKASEVMSIKPKLERNPSEYFRDLVSLSERNGMFPLVNLNTFMNTFEAFSQESYAPLIAKYQPKETASGEEESSAKKDEQSNNTGQPGAKPGESRIIGTAVFKKDKMVGKFDIYESQAFLLLTNQFKEAFLTIKDPHKKNDNIVFRLLATEPVQVKYRRQATRDQFFVKLNLEADIVSIQSGLDYTTPKMETFLAGYIAGDIKNRIIKLIRKSQQEYQSDVFGFGVKVRSSFLTSKDYEQYHWPDKFPEAEIKTKVKVAIRRVGVQFQPPKLR